MTYLSHVTSRFHGNHILTGVFFKISISLIKKTKSFLVACFNSLVRFMVFLFALITFELILDGVCGGFGQIQKSKMADQDGRHSEMIKQLLRHMTS